MPGFRCGAIPVTESNDDTGWIDLERGVKIRFAPGSLYRRGDYWLIPARQATGDIEWPAHGETPERIFERRWALSVLDRVMERLRNEFTQHGRPEHFERLKVFLLGQSAAPYATLALEVNTSEGALKVAIHRLRKRYRELFRQEITDTVADPAEVESELRYLAAVLSKT